MALSGTAYTSVGSHWRLQVEWSATQNVSANTSTVTVRLYWIGLNQYSAVYASATNSGSITANGTTSISATSGLSAGQKKLLGTRTTTVSHNAEGELDLSISASFDLNVTLQGSYVGTRSVSTTARLDDIPRASTLSSTANWTAGNNLGVTISRASSSFTHTVRIYTPSSATTPVKTFSNVGTGVTAVFNTTENTGVFDALNGNATVSSKIEVLTYSGGTLIGTTSKTGTVTAPSASTVNSGSASFNIGDSVSFSISRANSDFTHTVRIKLGSTTIATLTNIGTSTTWTPTSGQITSMHNTTPNSNSIGTTIEVETFYNGEKVRSTTTRTGTARVVNANPTFTASQFTYRDSKTSTATLTGNNQFIIQGQSTLAVNITSVATAQKGATMSKYVITADGRSVERTTTGESTVGTISSGANIAITVTAIDSRGNRTSVNKTATIIPYEPPAINAQVNRVNQFENNTVLDVTGSFSRVLVNGVQKNSISSVRYRWKEKSATTYSSNVTLTNNVTGSTYTTTPNVRALDNTKSYDYIVEVVDSFGTVSVQLLVPTGQPLFYIDKKNRSLGFNDFPTAPNEFKLNGRLVFGGNQWAGNATVEGGAGAMDLNNSDIFGLNGLYFNDRADNNGEGLLFLKTGATSGSTTTSDYDNVRALDGTLFMNGRVMGYSTDEILWSGGSYMSATQTITPTRSLSQCPNGWVLMWSRYNFNTNTTMNTDWNFTLIPRRFADLTAGGSWHTLQFTSDPVNSIGKYMYATNTTLTGHSGNNTGASREMVLRYVFPY